MSALAIRAALETALEGMSPAIATQWENAPYTPVVDTPYQRVNLLMNEPAAIEMSGAHHQEAGFMQVTLCYPLGTGHGAATTRAELIRQTFYRGATFTSGGVTTTIERHPEIAPALIEDDRYAVPVRVRFFANVARAA